jgi:hypothetical protein
MRVQLTKVLYIQKRELKISTAYLCQVLMLGALIRAYVKTQDPT